MKFDKKHFILNSILTKMKKTQKNNAESKNMNESAFSYDRDKNTFYRPNDESLIEYYNEDGRQTMVHTSWNN